MNSTDFTYWLQGFVELQDSDSISDKQWAMIKDHLKLVFDKITPVRTPDRNELQPNFPIYKPTIGSPLDLIGKKVDPNYWQPGFGNPPAITC